MRFGTKAVHAGGEPEERTGALNVPIFLSSTYSQLRQRERYDYGRTVNPTREALEKSVADLEEGRHGLAFSSGMGAVTTAMALLKKGDHVVVMDDVYGGTYRLFTQVYRTYGIEFSFVDGTRVEAVLRALRKNTRMVWMESPTNPLLKIVDMKAVAEAAHERGALAVMDNTFATPYLQQPLKEGFDLIVHSTTKYLGGHADVIGGAIITSDEEAHERLRFAQNAMGAVPSPFDCFLVLRGIKTLAVRMDRHCENAMTIARRLAEDRRAWRVIYPGLESHQQHELARRQMRSFGGIVTIDVRTRLNAERVMKRLRLIQKAESLGSVESLIDHPATMTHTSVPKRLREARGITDGLLRISVGIEDVDDLLSDLQRALEGTRAT